MQGIGPMGAPQAAAASAMPMPGAPQGGGFMGNLKGGLNDFLGSDASLAMAAGLLGGGSTSQAIGRGFGNAFQARQKSAPATTDDLTEFAFAKSQGYQGSFPDWMTMNKKAGATNVNVNTGEGEKFYDELDKGGAGMFNELLTSGVMAENKLMQLDALESTLANVPTGAQGAMKQIAGEWGIPTEGLDDIQAAQAIINQMVPQQRPPGSGPMSDRDVELFKASLPRIINQPGGNQTIIQTLRGVAEYEAAQGAIASAVANRKISPAEGRQQLAQLPNPLATFRAQSPSGQPSRLRYDPATGSFQ
jgi:flagellar protein FlgJ